MTPRLELLHRCRIRRRALQQTNAWVDRQHGLHRPVDVLERRTARRKDERLAERGDVTEERRVAKVARGDLVRGQVELVEQVGARLVEGGREEDEAELGA